MDYSYLKASDGTGDAALMHIDSARSIGATTIDVDGVSGVSSKFIGTYGTLVATGLIDPATKVDFYGHVDGTNLIIDGFLPGSVDNGNTEGQIVVIKPNSHWTNYVAQFLANALGGGTPDDLVAAAFTATSLTATSATLSGNISVAGNATITGNIDITGTSRLVPATVTTVSGSNNITPSKQLYSVTALGATATVLAPTWPAQDFMSGMLKIKDNGTARSLSWNAAWVGIGVTLPTATIAGKWLYVSYQYNASDSKFHVVGVARQS